VNSADDNQNLYPYTPPPPSATPAPLGQPPRRRSSRLTRTAAGLAVVLGAGAGAAAVAQATTSGSGSNGTTSTTKPAPTTPAPSTPGPWGRMGRMFGAGLGGPRAWMMGPMGAVHGQFTVPAPSGGYETIATQVGTVQSVSPSSLTVKSADGYSQTYAVSSSTIVDAGSEGIGSVKTGDTVAVMATVSGSTYTAQRVTDTTQVQANRQAWAPQPPTEPSPAA